MSATDLKEMRAALAREEAKTGNSGAIPRTPKQLMLDARDVEAKNPDKYVRWVNVRDPQKAQGRIMDGYEVMTEEAGGRSLGGSLKLMAIPRERHLERIAANKAAHKLRLQAHKTEMQQLAEGIARELRDKHGINVDAERILVSE
jgi:hypothetical protein